MSEQTLTTNKSISSVSDSSLSENRTNSDGLRHRNVQPSEDRETNCGALKAPKSEGLLHSFDQQKENDVESDEFGEFQQYFKGCEDENGDENESGDEKQDSDAYDNDEEDNAEIEESTSSMRSSLFNAITYVPRTITSAVYRIASAVIDFMCRLVGRGATPMIVEECCQEKHFAQSTVLHNEVKESPADSDLHEEPQRLDRKNADEEDDATVNGGKMSSKENEEEENLQEKNSKTITKESLEEVQPDEQSIELKEKAFKILHSKQFHSLLHDSNSKKDSENSENNSKKNGEKNGEKNSGKNENLSQKTTHGTDSYSARKLKPPRKALKLKLSKAASNFESLGEGSHHEESRESSTDKGEELEKNSQSNEPEKDEKNPKSGPETSEKSDSSDDKNYSRKSESTLENSLKFDSNNLNLNRHSIPTPPTPPPNIIAPCRPRSPPPIPAHPILLLPLVVVLPTLPAASPREYLPKPKTEPKTLTVPKKRLKKRSQSCSSLPPPEPEHPKMPFPPKRAFSSEEEISDSEPVSDWETLAEIMGLIDSMALENSALMSNLPNYVEPDTSPQYPPPVTPPPSPIHLNCELRRPPTPPTPPTEIIAPCRPRSPPPEPAYAMDIPPQPQHASARPIRSSPGDNSANNRRVNRQPSPPQPDHGVIFPPVPSPAVIYPNIHRPLMHPNYPPPPRPRHAIMNPNETRSSAPPSTRFPSPSQGPILRPAMPLPLPDGPILNLNLARPPRPPSPPAHLMYPPPPPPLPCVRGPPPRPRHADLPPRPQHASLNPNNPQLFPLVEHDPIKPELKIVKLEVVKLESHFEVVKMEAIKHTPQHAVVRTVPKLQFASVIPPPETMKFPSQGVNSSSVNSTQENPTECGTTPSPSSFNQSKSKSQFNQFSFQRSPLTLKSLSSHKKSLKSADYCSKSTQSSKPRLKSILKKSSSFACAPTPSRMRSIKRSQSESAVEGDYKSYGKSDDLTTNKSNNKSNSNCTSNNIAQLNRLFALLAQDATMNDQETQNKSENSTQTPSDNPSQTPSDNLSDVHPFDTELDRQIWDIASKVTCGVLRRGVRTMNRDGYDENNDNVSENSDKSDGNTDNNSGHDSGDNNDSDASVESQREKESDNIDNIDSDSTVVESKQRSENYDTEQQ